ncbi:MAG: hypothetical protein KF716_01015 [Anaerolineae bacterium]|nr:hypothetical protein [Anaerolineae bacterium]
MMNDSENPELDNEMANLTDALLAGRSIKASASAQPLEPIVRGLQQLSASSQPSDEFRARLTQRLSSEFEAQSHTRPLRNTGLFSRRYRSVLAAAAVLVLVGIAVLLGSQGGTPTTVGTALGSPTAVALAVISVFVIVLVGLGVYFWWRERK